MRITMSMLWLALLCTARTCDAAFLASAVQFRSSGEYPHDPPSAILARNALQMAALVADMAIQGSSFIAFPEFSLLPPATPLNPQPFSFCRSNKTAFAEFCETLPGADDSRAPCSAASPSPLSILSCASKSHPSVAISYNTCEVSTNGRLYNTQVVLRDGLVVTSYRKLHPWYTECFDVPELQLRSFDVNGSTVGVFTCKDILYHDPKASLLAAGVRVFSYSSAIELVAHELVQDFARAHNVTVISSDRASVQTQIVSGLQTPVDCKDHGAGACVATAWVDM